MSKASNILRPLFFLLALILFPAEVLTSAEKSREEVASRGEAEAIAFRILPVARIQAREFFVRKGGGLWKRSLAAYSFLIQHPEKGNVLIDLGYPEVSAEKPGAYPGFPVSWLMDIQMEREDHVAEKIQKAGIGPDDVNLILFTHLHNDHMGDIRLFKSSRILVHKKEWEAAMEQGRRHGFRPDYLEALTPALFEFPETSPYGPFDRSLDIFGDGSIIAVPTPGHTKGHVSYFINTGIRRFFLTGDTAWVEDNFQRPARKGWLTHMVVEDDRKAQRDSLNRIHELYREQKDLVIIPGHDARTAEDERLKPYLLD